MGADTVEQTCSIALLLVDVINDMDFPGSEPLVEQAVPMARRLAALKKRTSEAGVPGSYICVVFSANDAHMRDLPLYVPRDCTLSKTGREKTMPPHRHGPRAK